MYVAQILEMSEPINVSFCIFQPYDLCCREKIYTAVVCGGNHIYIHMYVNGEHQNIICIVFTCN